METSFTVGDDHLDDILIVDPSSLMADKFDLVISRKHETIPLCTWMQQASESLVDAMYRSSVPLRVAQLWDPVLACPDLAETIKARREDLQRMRNALQQMIQSSAPAEAAELDKKRQDCVQEIKKASDVLKTFTHKQITYISTVAKTLQEAATEYVDALDTMKTMQVDFRLSNPIDKKNAWKTRIDVIIDDEYTDHKLTLVKEFMPVLAHVKESAPSSPQYAIPHATGIPQLDRVATSSIELLELTALHQMTEAFERVAHAIGKCACPYGDCVCESQQ